MGDRVKDMDIVSFSQGNFFFFKSLQDLDKSIVTQMLHQVLAYSSSLFLEKSSKSFFFPFPSRLPPPLPK